MQLQPGLVDPRTGQAYAAGPYAAGPIGFTPSAFPTPAQAWYVLGLVVLSWLVPYAVYRGIQTFRESRQAEEANVRRVTRNLTLAYQIEQVEYQEYYHEPLEQQEMFPQMFAGIDIAPESMNDLEGAKPRSRMTDDEIQAAGRAAFHLGAGWGGFSVTNEGGIATIDSGGRISWSGFGGLGQQGKSQFASGKDAIDAIASLFGRGRDDSANAPNNTAPPSSPPNSPPDDPAY